MIEIRKGGQLPVAIAVFTVAALVSTFFLLRMMDGRPIVADGKENLTAAVNLANNFVFSSASPATPDMTREPAWPALAALVIVLASFQDIGVDDLSTSHARFFKAINVALYALTIGLAGGCMYVYTRKPVVALPVLVLSAAIFGSLPRLVNSFNNEALATLLLLVASILLAKNFRVDSTRWGIALGAACGLLALTKAQFLYIALAPLLLLLFVRRKQATAALVCFALFVSPWIMRNSLLFDEPAISERGKTVAAVRLVMTLEPMGIERSCMAVAFSHPDLRTAFGGALGIELQDFERGGRCQRLNREICFDMGTRKVGCAPFPEDLAQGAWDNKIQYFYRGFAAGKALENNQLKITDLAAFNLDALMKYIETLPIFAWRGIGFSDFPVLSILLSIALFALVFTPLRTFALLAIAAHLFHVLLTHNIPRYHAIELAVMIVAGGYWLERLASFVLRIVWGRSSKRFRSPVAERDSE